MSFIILENTNDLTKSIACDSSAVGKLMKRWEDNPPLLLSRNAQTYCHFLMTIGANLVSLLGSLCLR
ncbi:MAG TPA: hypothetical protein PK079_13600 [Leptospiraceae bacterium]|nr:hypothetical protein [Leptospiraceae bacterium]HMW05272.1 hypothetical protein [Leptospiraceae bacterium]HMX33645.1 hypothetical protein [Leptospiraceae bacterium]HMY31468.1 hypothetical protein [Leptospiraceae bacterium]HMZ66007.1 hypothetical protein [Leptospiraceae bacterium]